MRGGESTPSGNGASGRMRNGSQRTVTSSADRSIAASRLRLPIQHQGQVVSEITSTVSFAMGEGEGGVCTARLSAVISGSGMASTPSAPELPKLAKTAQNIPLNRATRAL
jgi:hypothetical protein